MKALRITEKHGKAEFHQIDTPFPKATQVQVEIKACGLNFADLLIQNGTYQDIPATPFTMGMEIAGVVTQVGESVSGLKCGDRVAVYAGQGGLAEHGVFEADRAVKLP